MFVVAGLDGYFKRANPAFCHLLGYSEAQLLAKPYLEFVHPQDVDKVTGAVTNLTSGHPAFLVQVRLLAADGSYHPLEWTAYPDLEAGLLFAIARDEGLSNLGGQQLKRLIDSSPTAVFLVQQDGTIIDSNQLAEIIFRYERGQLLGKSIEMLVPAKYRKNHLQHRKKYTAEPTLRPMGKLHNLVGLRKNGEEFPIDVGLNPSHLGPNTIIICSVIDTSAKSELLNTLIQDRARLERAKTRLAHLADHDTLTGLYNRRAFERLLLGNLSAARKTGDTISIILADIDHFKDYNDTFGHLAGDRVLKRLGELLNLNIRREDTVARVGGEEFVIVLPGLTYEDVSHFGERLRKVIEQDQAAMRPVTISLGAATHLFRSKDIALKRIREQLVTEADQAMYHSKTAGRNLFSHFADHEPGE